MLQYLSFFLAHTLCACCAVSLCVAYTTLTVKPFYILSLLHQSTTIRSDQFCSSHWSSSAADSSCNLLPLSIFLFSGDTHRHPNVLFFVLWLLLLNLYWYSNICIYNIIFQYILVVWKLSSDMTMTLPIVFNNMIIVNPGQTAAVSLINK